MNSVGASAPPGASSGPPEALQGATDVLRAVLGAVTNREPAVIVEAPPGSGKSFLVELVAGLGHHLGMRLGIACQTNAQTDDLAQRISTAYPAISLVRLSSTAYIGPAIPTYKVVHNIRQAPRGPAVILSTAAKWSGTDTEQAALDVLVIDEAWQMTDATFVSLSRLASQYLMVGDPGQIAPVVRSDIRQWRHLKTGPHQPAPTALHHRQADHIWWLQLPATRRLSPDTVQIVQPAFYPHLPFTSAAPRWRLEWATPSPPLEPLGAVLGRSGVSLGGRKIRPQVVWGRLPESYPGAEDPQLAATVAATVYSLLLSGRISRGGDISPCTPNDIMVLCAHRSQVAAVRARLNQQASTVRVDTAERLQGQETAVSIVYHPLSGLVEMPQFDRDAGRMCVMLSRHRAACIVLGRAGMWQQLRSQSLSSERILSGEPDPGYVGWSANMKLLELLDQPERRADISFGR